LTAFVERGSGDPLVFVPGLQGRWEYHRPTVEALSRTFRVMTFSLADRVPPPPQHGGTGLDGYVSQIAAALDRAAVPRAVICGVSFGGLVALRFAARYPERTAALVLASTPGPLWTLRPRHEVYARYPLALGPLFLMETPFRLRREVPTAIPSRAARVRFTLGQLRTLVRARPSIRGMARRARLISASGRTEECAVVTAPTLILHGEPRLDHVVDVAGTTEYGRLIRDARVTMLAGTGHLGSITRADAFAGIVREFVTTSGAEHSNHAA
jgi:pimeloyl-ACP methyl ester carboxylesterase